MNSKDSSFARMHNNYLDPDRFPQNETKSMRTVSFTKLPDNEWESRPFQGWQYKIIKRWQKGYTLYFNGEYLDSDTRLQHLRDSAKEHLASHYPTK